MESEAFLLIKPFFAQFGQFRNSCNVLKEAFPKKGFENLTSNFMPLTGKNLEVGDSLGM